MSKFRDFWRTVTNKPRPVPFEAEIYGRQQRMAEEARQRLTNAIEREEEINRLLNIMPQRGPSE